KKCNVYTYRTDKKERKFMSEDKGNQEITSEEQQELMEKYDTESNTRNLTGWIAAVVFVILLSFSLFQLYTGIFGMYTAYIQRSIHLGFALSFFLFFFISIFYCYIRYLHSVYSAFYSLRFCFVFSFSIISSLEKRQKKESGLV